MDPRLLTASLLCAISALAGIPSQAQHPRPNANEVLWYKTPAPIWDNALPIGNGRLGAMVFGGANSGANNGDLQASPNNAPLMDGSQTSGADEHLQLNESGSHPSDGGSDTGCMSKMS